MAITEQHRIRRRKHSHGEQNTVPIDRISDLPDSVLCHILSFLRTKFSVRTSILCKRWRYLWSYVPTLDFYSEDEKIINRVMLLRKVQTVHNFRLRQDIDCDPYQFGTWVTFATMRGVQKLDLSLGDEGVLPSLPGCLFTCKTLVHLRLYNCGNIPVNGAVCLPCLKILHLIFVPFEADESLPHILSGCPVLQELEIRLDLGLDMVYCNVSSPTLKRLVLDFEYDGCGGRSDKLEMNTPALEYLKINNCSCEHIKGGVLTSFIKAEISFCNDEEKDDYYLFSRSLLEFFDRLCNVKFLTLDFSYCPGFVDSVLSTWTKSFRNLTKLELTSDWRFLSKFLANADNLEILIFNEHCEEIEGRAEPPQQVPACLLSNLRIIQIVNIRGEKHEFDTIRYLLRNSKVLEQMKITYSRLSSNGEIDMLKKISLFQRGSTACEVAFVGVR